jgi:hypothetical protein
MVAGKLMLLGTGRPTTVAATTLIDVNTPERKRENDDYWNGGTLYIASGVGGPSNQLLSEASPTDTVANGGTVTDSSTDPLDTTCVKLTTTATASSSAKRSYAVTVTAGTIYELSVWTKGSGTVCANFGVYRTTATAADIIPKTPTQLPGKDWSRIIRRFITPAGCLALTVDLYSSDELSSTVYFDKPSLRRIGQERYISDWVQSTNTFTVATWTTNPDVNSYYEAYYKTFSFADYNRVLDDALRYAYPFLYRRVEDTSIETTSGDYSYALPPSIDPLAVIKVELEDNTGESTAPYAPYAFWRIRENNGSNTLQFDVLPPATRTIRITHCQPIEPLMTDFDTVEAAWVPYIVARAQAELYEQMLAKTTRSDRTQVGENRDAFYQKAAYELKRVAMQWPNTPIKPHLYGGH